jgi:PqqD family protein of HPr-rel-A system
VFSPHSWDTHYLNEAAALVLDFLADEPRTATDVGRFMAELLRPEEQEAADDHARGVLNELLALRLIVAEDRGSPDGDR